ncbi:TPA: hypothetical protein ACTYTR_003585 [Klebsiella michiganensis]
MSFTILGPAFFGSFSWSPKRHHKAAVLSHSRQTDIDTKKPAGLTPCGLLGLHRMTLVITAGEFWWSWRELNPHPKVFNSMKLKNFILKDIYA